MAQVALAFFDLQLGAHPAVFAEPQHDHPAAVHRDLQRGGAALVAGGLGLFIGNIVAAALLHELAAGHQLHKLFFFLILHRLVDVLFDAALDADDVIFLQRFTHVAIPCQYLSMAICSTGPPLYSPRNRSAVCTKLSGTSLT